MTGISLLGLACSIILLAAPWAGVWRIGRRCAVVSAMRMQLPAVRPALHPRVGELHPGLLCLTQGQTPLAGLCFGLFVPFKYFPAVILIYFPVPQGMASGAGAGLRHRGSRVGEHSRARWPFTSNT